MDRRRGVQGTNHVTRCVGIAPHSIDIGVVCGRLGTSPHVSHGRISACWPHTSIGSHGGSSDTGSGLHASAPADTLSLLPNDSLHACMGSRSS